jgi:hypothetical protein
MRGLVPLLISLTGIAPAHAGITIPVTEEVGGFLAIIGGIGLAIYFIYEFIKFRRWVRQDKEMRGLRPEEFEAQAPYVSEKQKREAKLEAEAKEAGDRFVQALKKSGSD